MRRRRQSNHVPPTVVPDRRAADRRHEVRTPLQCPVCHSPRIQRVARLKDTLACLCDACNTEFVITTQQEPI